jgi:hypothetical protein
MINAEMIKIATFLFLGWGKTRPLDTWAANGPFYQSRVMDEIMEHLVG